MTENKCSCGKEIILNKKGPKIGKFRKQFCSTICYQKNYYTKNKEKFKNYYKEKRKIQIYY